ncbi:MAG: glycosyltransferase family 4 protein [Anaerolineaceae bacterium]|nr:glycosyltransferase family 4 protein [Anaerolineaceae bacterium]
MDPHRKLSVQRIAFVGNYIPRQCGIATFTTDLVEAVTSKYPETTGFAIAMNDIKEGYPYPPRVRFEITEEDAEAYHRAADYLNLSGADVVNLQHEYGIFGGVEGSHILTFLREIRIPVVTTLHTVLRSPSEDQCKVMRALADLSNRLVVMSRRGEQFLQDIYRIPADKIDFIPHGIPDVPFVDPNFYKDKFGVEGKFVLLTFGLLSQNKGIENVIQALPAIIKHHPEVVYIVLGATHPNVIRHDGEAYRISLKEMAKRLGVSRQVKFINRFVSVDELVEYIGAADIYITPYLNPQQITSGTLAYTVGAGKAVISTPYWYAEELLEDDRGILVPFSDPQAIADQVNNLIENEALRHAMRKRAYLSGREMIWPKVAEAYMHSFERACLEPISRSHNLIVAVTGKEGQSELPAINLYHLTRMTDSTGLLQHAIYDLPNYLEGYTTDDNSRALMVAFMLERLGDEWFTGAAELGVRYLSFLWYAFNRENGRFRNFMSFDRRWLEQSGSEDSHGRALWALGMVAGNSGHESMHSVAGILFNQGLPAVLDFTSPRSWSFTVLGIIEYMHHFAGDRFTAEIGAQLTQRLLDIYLSTSSPEWHWFENEVTYNNAILSHALLVGGHWLGRTDMVDAALESLEWLIDIQTMDGLFSPVGNQGFMVRGGDKPIFDQQPIEAYATITACLQAYRLAGDEKWIIAAHKAFSWFLGENALGISLYNPETGGCKDGLHPDRVNENEGAESTLSFQLSLLELRLFERFMHSGSESSAPITLLSLKTRIEPD